MKFNYNYLILLLTSMFEANGTVTHFGKYEIISINDKLKLKMNYNMISYRITV